MYYRNCKNHKKITIVQHKMKMDLLDRVRILFKANNTKILIKFKGETMRKSLCLYSTSKRSYYNNLNY